MSGAVFTNFLGQMFLQVYSYKKWTLDTALYTASGMYLLVLYILVVLQSYVQYKFDFLNLSTQHSDIPKMDIKYVSKLHKHGTVFTYVQLFLYQSLYSQNLEDHDQQILYKTNLGRNRNNNTIPSTNTSPFGRFLKQK